MPRPRCKTCDRAMISIYAHNTGDKRKVGYVCPYCMMEGYITELQGQIEALKRKGKNYRRRIGELKAEVINLKKG